MQTQLFWGRQLFLTTPPSFTTQMRPALKVGGLKVHCQRCGQSTWRWQAALPRHQYYCPQCLNLGRMSTLGQLYHLPEPNQFSVPNQLLTWKGQLSPLQSQVAKQIKQTMLARQTHLVWAVTGAGKTEMLYPALAAALERGERVAIASPRIDVVLELAPRLQAAFAQVEQVVLTGQTPQYRYCQLTLCTTHQLLRFYHAFDQLIVDEVDAFPYAGNQALLYAAKQASKPTGACTYLTATPGPLLQRQARREHWQVSYLPRRFHGHPLPEIEFQQIANWRARPLAAHLQQWLRQRLGLRECLIFVPKIADINPLLQSLRSLFPMVRQAGVYAADPERTTKVQRMRQHHLDWLVTTTILERGVTLPGIDVLVLGADEGIFSSAALVQIAGRVGRSAQCPTGTVLMVGRHQSATIQVAKNEIKMMNRRGGF